MNDNNDNEILPPKIKGFKLVSSETLVTWASGPMKGIYVFHNPYKFMTVISPTTGAVSGTQLVPWIEAGVSGSPIVIDSNKIITIFDIDQEYQRIYHDLIFSRNVKSKESSKGNQEKPKEISLVSFNKKIKKPKKSKAPIELVFDKDFDSLSNDPFLDEDSLDES